MEVRIRQASGLKHCKNIRRVAKRLWKESNYRYGYWDECLRTAIRLHCEEVYAAQKNREKAKAEGEEHPSQMDFRQEYGFHVGCF